MSLLKLQLKKREMPGIEMKLNLPTIKSLLDQDSHEAFKNFFEPVLENDKIYRHDRELLAIVVNKTSDNKKRSDIDRIIKKFAIRVSELCDDDEHISVNVPERFALRQILPDVNYELPLTEWAAFDDYLETFLEETQEEKEESEKE